MAPESKGSRLISRSESDDGESFDFFYLTPEAARELPHYQYKGEDQSLLYKYILSPLASFCVNHLTPSHVAPNTITFIGLLLMVGSYTVMAYHVPTLEPVETAPRWIFLLNGIAMLCYQTLDNMDGKQARRTRSSSPLGVLFDHGCDAVNSIFGSANWMISMALHPSRDSWLCWSILFGPYGLFYVATWEQFYTGELIMPIVNGPNEGLMGGALMSLTSWYCGPQYWQQRDWWNKFVQLSLPTLLPVTWLSPDGLRNADLLVLASSIGFIQEILLKIKFVVRVYGYKTLWGLLPFATLLLCSLLVSWFDIDVWLNMRRTSLHLCAVLFVEMTAELMLAHISGQQYRPVRFILLPLVILTVAIVSGYLTAGQQTNDILLAYTSGAAVFLFMKAAIVIHEICVLLNVWCFDIVTPRRRVRTTGNGHINKED